MQVLRKKDTIKILKINKINLILLHIIHQQLLKSHPNLSLQAVDLNTTINAYLLDPPRVFVHHNLQVEVGMKMGTPEDLLGS